MDPRHVVSLENAKQMRELGFPQNTEFEWWEGHGKNGLKPTENQRLSGEDFQYYAAPLSSELVEMLPHEVETWTEEQADGKWSNDWLLYETFPSTENGNCYTLKYVGDCYGGDFIAEIFVQQAKTEVEVRAKMLIYLATHSLLNPK